MSTSVSSPSEFSVGSTPTYSPTKAKTKAGEDEYTPSAILLTGGCGFIGSHVVLHLVRKYPQYQMIVLDKLDYCASLGHLEELAECDNFNFIHGNILSEDLVMHILRQYNIDTIMHFAASTHVDNSFSSSLSFTENNVMGTHTLLECARVYGGIKRFVHISTDEVYGGEGLLQTEANGLLEPTNPYACSKAAAEFLCRGYIRSFNFPIVITRGNNVYGPHQFPDKLIPKSAVLLAEGKPCFIHGDGSHQRNFLYCKDAARAFDMVLHKGKIGEVYNIGSPKELTTLDVVKDLIKVFGYSDESKFMTFVKDRAFNDVRYSIDSSKIRELGWEPQMSWEDGLAETVRWYTDLRNLSRWPHYKNGLIAHPSLDNHHDLMGVALTKK